MKKYKVLLHRDYVVNVNAMSEVDAKLLGGFFIGGEKTAQTQ